MRSACLRVLRRHLVVRGLSVWLVVLVLMPFTAPFAAFDIVDVSAGGLHGDEKLGPDEGKCALSLSGEVIVAVVAIVDAAAIVRQCHTPLLPDASRPLVLRI